MEPLPVHYNAAEYVETMTGNKVSRKALLLGISNIRLSGKAIIKHGTTVRGDLSSIAMGRFSILSDGTIMRPPYKRFKGGVAFFPVTIGDYVFIEEDCVIEAATIGSFVHIGKNSVIAKRCVLKDCCRILEGTILPPDTVVPPFCVFGGQPGRLQGELPESWEDEQRSVCLDFYDRFLPAPTSPTK